MRSRIHALMAASLVSGIVLVLCGRDSRPSQDVAPKDGANRVIVRVSVTDPLNRYVADLEQKQFMIYAGRTPQTVTYFAYKSAPISAVFVHDNAARDLSGKVSSVRDILTRLLQPDNPKQEFLLILCDAKTAQIESLTHQGSIVRDTIPLGAGPSPLSAAVRVGLDQIKKLNGEKKALVVITNSANSLEVETAPNPEFQVYAIARIGRASSSSKPSGIFELTGGREYLVSSFDQLDYYIDLIHEELRNQYILGFVPSTGKLDLKRLKVQVNTPAGAPKLTVHTQSTYYAK